MKKFEGEQIREVWDYRLSNAVPCIVNTGPTWIVEIHAKDNPSYNPAKPETLAEPLEVFDTGIPSEPGDTWDAEKIKVCYAWLYSVRDKYAREDIETLKPAVAKINEAIAAFATLHKVGDR